MIVANLIYPLPKIKIIEGCLNKAAFGFLKTS